MVVVYKGGQTGQMYSLLFLCVLNLPLWRKQILAVLFNQAYFLNCLAFSNNSNLVTLIQEYEENISASFYSHAVQLVLTSSRGGVWRYPLKFIATEADPDDVIELEAIGLHKNVSVGFRLTSQSE